MLRALMFSLLAVIPTSTNYTLRSYDFGQGSNTGSSASYTLQGQAGGQNGSLVSSSYTLPAGVKASTTVAVPAAPTLTDVNSAYATLHLVLNAGSFPSDTKFLIAISSDNFVTTQYVQLDDTIGSTVSIANYQNYTAWGGGTGFDILGLASSTTYKVKVAALQGSGTGSAFGPTASAATSAPSVTFSLQTSLTSTPPFSVAFASLAPGTPVSGDATITGTVTTNAGYGGSLVVSDSNGGLSSALKSFTLASATADLSLAASGYGARVSGVSQSSGGPIAASSPYNGSGNAVGGLSTSAKPYASWSAPLTSGSATLNLLAKSTALTPASGDYADVITISLSLLF